jgi:hypothetical protein
MEMTNATFDACRKLVETVPVKTILFGVHRRVHLPGQSYAYSFEQPLAVVTSFLERITVKKPTVFAFAFDSKYMEAELLEVFGEKTLLTKTIRTPDFDHRSALLDLVLLQMHNDCLLSFRSTFSFSVASRSGKICFFVEKEAPEVFQLGNAQAGSVSMRFHFLDVNDW